MRPRYPGSKPIHRKWMKLGLEEGLHDVWRLWQVDCEGSKYNLLQPGLLKWEIWYLKVCKGVASEEDELFFILDLLEVDISEYLLVLEKNFSRKILWNDFQKKSGTLYVSGTYAGSTWVCNQPNQTQLIANIVPIGKAINWVTLTKCNFARYSTRESWN